MAPVGVSMSKQEETALFPLAVGSRCGMESLAARSQAKPTRPRSDTRERARKSGSNKLIFVDEWHRKVVVQYHSQL